ncbi:multidrug transporter MatE [Clostridia bacterium]|nr:multidrug transporter MatE [Clostridia bacterium]
MEENRLGTEKISKLIPKFAVPAAISMLVGSFYNIADQIFIGQGVGMLGNAATNIAFPITTISMAFALLFGIGGASSFNLLSGAGETEKAVKTAGTALFLLGICGVIIGAATLIFLNPLLLLFGVTDEILPFARDYMGITAIGIPFLVITAGGNHLIRADRSPTYSMVSMLSGAILNTILDPIFIFAFGWGIKGAAWATVISQAVSFGFVLIYFIRLKKMPLRLKYLRPSFPIVKNVAALGSASSVNQVAMAAVQIVMNNTLKYYGAASVYGSEIPIAAVGVIAKVNMVFLAFSIGLSQGCQPIWGYNRGAKKYSRVIETYNKAAVTTLIIGAAFFAAFQIFPRQIVSIFGGGSDEYFVFAERYLRIFMAFTLLNGLQPMSSGFFTSIGKAKLGMLMSLTRQVVFLIPLVLLLPLAWGIDGVMFAGPVADCAAVALAVFFAHREIVKMKKEAERL